MFVFDCRFSEYWSPWRLVVGVDIEHEGGAASWLATKQEIAAGCHLSSVALLHYLAAHGVWRARERVARRVSDFNTLQALALDVDADVAHTARVQLEQRHFIASLHRHWVNTDAVPVPYTGAGFAD